jgi:hypothetical protein
MSPKGAKAAMAIAPASAMSRGDPNPKRRRRMQEDIMVNKII